MEWVWRISTTRFGSVFSFSKSWSFPQAAEDSKARKNNTVIRIWSLLTTATARNTFFQWLEILAVNN